MAILTRFLIERFKEVILPESAGTISDGGFSTYNLDDPTLVPSGTGDFLGVIRDIRLLGEVVKITVDTKRYTINQFNALTQQQYDELVRNGGIGLREEVIGWVQINKARPSFYYKDCDTSEFIGKQPIVEHYYTLSDFLFDTKVVNGSGPNDESSDFSFSQLALNGIKNFDPNIGNNLGPIGPRFNPINLNEYMTAAFYNGIVTNADGETRNINLLGNSETRPLIVGLYLANKSEHFNNKNARQSSDGKYGFIRNTVNDAFTTYSHIVNTNAANESIISYLYEGSCLEIERKTRVPDPPSGGDDDIFVTPPDISNNTGGPNKNGNYDYDTYDNTPTGPVPFREIKNLICSETFQQLPIRYPNIGLVEPSSSTLYSVSNTELNYNKDTRTTWGEDDQFAYLAKFEDRNRELGAIDPREISTNTSYAEKGTIKFIKNNNECTLDVYPNFRDKDGDVPEIVGPVVAEYLENVRAQFINDFNTPIPLRLIGVGSDGLDYYSDGNSYIELHSEAVFGCGEPFGFSDIPEIFTEMYPTISEINGTRRGFSERKDVELYRFVVERSSKISGLLLSLIQLIGPSTAYKVLESKKILTINDVIDDITLGIPDMDFAQIGSPDFWGKALGAAGGAAIAGLAQYYLGKKQSNNGKDVTEFRKILEIVKSTALGAIGGKSLVELLETEQDIYNKNGTDKLSGKTGASLFEEEKPTEFFKYKHYDSFWSDPILSSVYAENNGIIKEEYVDDNGNFVINQTELKVSTPDTNSIWHESDRTIRELKELQFGLSLPSRWKSMMRPIYQELWHDQEEIKPENVATSPYLGQPITALELGDYETHRSIFGMNKNLYDKIDDVISVKLHTDTLQEIFSGNNPPNIFDQFVNDSERLFDSFIDRVSSTDQVISGTIGRMEKFKDFSMSLSQLIRLALDFKPDELKSYLDIANKSLIIYGQGSDIYNDFISSMGDVEELAEKLSNPKTYESEIEKLTDDIFESLQTTGLNLLRGLFNEINNYILMSGLQYLENSLEVVKINRVLFSPRRIMKPGSVFLQSKYGQYSTNRQPCPIIFLGFNDDAIMSTFSELNPGAINCLSRLTKNDKISTIKCSNLYPLKSGEKLPLFAEVLQTNLGNYALELDLSSEPNIGLGRSVGEETAGSTKVPYEYTKYSKVDQMPTINKRIRQYGRNPFLDIFYLNLIPDSYYASDANLEQKNTKTHLSSTPSPFRYPTLNNIRFSKVMNSNIPSIFPPWWNEPIVNETYPEAKNDFYELNSKTTFWQDFENWNLGDTHFRKRRRNNILRAKDRWSMSLQSIGNNQIVVLTDKTPILDIYFGLMDMHINGFDWGTIIPLIKEAKNAITITEYIDSTGRVLPDEENSSINITALERVNTKIRKLLARDESVAIFNELDWFGTKPVEDKPVANTKLAILRNSTQNGYEILGNQIKIISDGSTDKFGQSAENVFYFGDIVIEEGDGEKIVSPYGVEFTMKTWNVNTTGLPGGLPGIKRFSVGVGVNMDYGLPVHFIPFRVEPNFEYKAKLEIPVIINKNTDEEELFLVTTELSAICTINPYNAAEESTRYLNLQIPYQTHFGIVSDLSTYTEPIGKETNDGFLIPFEHILHEDILIETMEINNQKILNSKDEPIQDNYFDDGANLFRFSKYDIDSYNSPANVNNTTFLEFYEPSYYSERKREGTLGTAITSFSPIVQIDKEQISRAVGNILPEKNLYSADLFVNYVLMPRMNSTQPIYRREKTKLVFASSK